MSTIVGHDIHTWPLHHPYHCQGGELSENHTAIVPQVLPNKKKMTVLSSHSSSQPWERLWRLLMSTERFHPVWFSAGTSLSRGCWQAIDSTLRALAMEYLSLNKLKNCLCSFHPRVLVSSLWTTRNKPLHCFPWEPFRMLQTDGVFALWLLVSMLFSVVPTDTPFLSNIVSSTLPS